MGRDWDGLRRRPWSDADGLNWREASECENEGEGDELDDDPGDVPPDERGAAEAVALLVLRFDAGDELHLVCNEEGHWDRPATHAIVEPDPNSRVIVGPPAYQFEPICSECAERVRDYLRVRDK